MTFEQKILKAIDRYAKKTGLSEVTIGKRIANESGFYERLSNGGGITTRTYQRAVEWFSEKGITI